MSSQTPTGWCWDGEMQRRYNPGFEERRWQEYTPDAGRPGGPGYAQSSLPPLLPPPATGSSSFILSTPPNIPLQQPLSSTQTCSGYASHEIDANHRSVPLSGPVSPERTSRRRQSLSANHNRTSLFNPLHSDYKMRPASFFMRFRVFIIYWPENAGVTADAASMASGSITQDVQHGEPIFSKFRRMIVIGVTSTHCLCVPVQTYGKKAAAKACINPQHHAIAFTGKVPPRPTPEEMEFKAHKTMLPSIRIDPDVRWDSLDPHSRVCYSEVYPVQLNVRVKAVGVVHPRYQQDFVKSYLAVLKDTIVPESVPAHAAALGQGFAPRLRQSSIVASTSDACYPPHSLHEGEDIDSSSSQAYSTSSMTSKLATMDVRLTQPVAAPARPTRHLFHPNTSK